MFSNISIDITNNMPPLTFMPLTVDQFYNDHWCHNLLTFGQNFGMFSLSERCFISPVHWIMRQHFVA